MEKIYNEIQKSEAKPDFSSTECGGEVLHSEGGVSTSSILGYPLTYPSILLHPSIHPGNCWPCKTPCRVKINLCSALNPTNIVIHHIPESISTSINGIATAPRDMILKVGNVQYPFRFDRNGPSQQTFPLNSTFRTDDVTLEILSSWHHPNDVACLYKVQIY